MTSQNRRIVNTGPQGGIRVNSGRNRLPTKEEREELYLRFADLYSSGMSDLGIAEITGACDKTVRRWRWREELPNIYGKAHDGPDKYGG